MAMCERASRLSLAEVDLLPIICVCQRQIGCVLPHDPKSLNVDEDSKTCAEDEDRCVPNGVTCIRYVR